MYKQKEQSIGHSGTSNDNLQRVHSQLNSTILLNIKLKKMKNLTMLPLILLLLLYSSCSEDTFMGSGNLIMESRNVEAFTKVKSEGTFDVHITQGATQSVEIIADDNVIHKVTTRVVNNELELSFDSNNDSYDDISLQANIVVTRLNGLKNSGIGNIYATDIEESGSFSIVNSGAGNITLNGSAPGLNLKNEGSGNIFGFNFLVDDCDVDNEGAGLVETHCSDHLNVSIEGSGYVFYRGNPIIDVNISGSGRLIDAN
jgi:hypothetical protein